MVIDQFLTINEQDAILVKKVKEYRSCYSFVSIEKTVIFRYEI